MQYLKQQAQTMLHAYLAFIIVPCLLFFFHIEVGFVSLAISCLLWLTLNYFLIPQTTVRKHVFLLLISCLIFCIGAYASSLVYEFAFDGMWYHQTAIIHLKQGWNPIYEEILQSEEPAAYRNLNCIPKAAWIAASQIYWLWGNIEASKILTGWLMLVAFGLTASALYATGKFNKIISVSAAMLMALNPIAVNQLTSSYIDGQVASLFLCICALAILYVSKREHHYLILFLLTLTVFANMKVTATVITFMSMAGSFIYLATTEKINWKKYLLWYTIAGLFAILILGFSPFVKNTITYHDPLYPIFEKDYFKQDGVYPPSFKNTNRFTRFYLSLFSQPGFPNNEYDIIAKNLFKKTYIGAFKNGSPVVGSFGAFSAEILICLAVFFIILSLIFYRTSWKYWLIILFLTATIFINQEAWVGRYSPQYWLVLCLMWLFITSKKYSQLVGIITAIAMFVNIFIIAGEHIHSNIKKTKLLTACVHELKENKDAAISAGWTTGFKHRFKILQVPPEQQRVIYSDDTTAIAIEAGLDVMFKRDYFKH